MPQRGQGTNVSPELGDIDGISVAVAHWHVPAWGGAENLVTQLAAAVGAETVFTIGEPSPSGENPYGDVEWVDVSTGPAASLKRRLGRAGEYALWEDIDWRDHGDPDVLITSGSTTRAVITPDDTLHVNYCHSPPRWLYDLYHDRKGSLVGKLARPLLRYLRLRDSAVDDRVDRYFANSPIVARRLWKFYKRDAAVLCPPVDVDAYSDRGDDGFYLHLGRLDEEKGVPAVVAAFDGSERRLVLAGGRGDVDDALVVKIEGSDRIRYEGFVDENRKRELLGSCRALVFNGVNEDFGIVPVEANAAGKASLVPDSGFPGVYVRNGENGYRHDGTAAGISDCLDRFETDGIASDPSEYADRYSTQSFEQRLLDTVETWYRSFEARATVESESL